MSCYVALDGPDGCGKSTQATALVSWLDAEGADVLHVREPGSTPVGEALRGLLLSPDTGDLQAISEALLFSAARAELMHRVVRPALDAGKVVVAERCYLSTAAYQLLAVAPSPGVMDLRWFEDLTRRVHGDCLPDAIFVLDVTPGVSAQRRGRRAAPADRIRASAASAAHSFSASRRAPSSPSPPGSGPSIWASARKRNVEDEYTFMELQ